MTSAPTATPSVTPRVTPRVNLTDLVRLHYDAFARGDLDAAASVFSPDVETTVPGGTTKGLAEFRAMGEMFRTAAPDSRMEVVRSWEVGDTVVVEGVYAGTHTGPLVGDAGTVPASGRAFVFPFADFLQFRDGLCVSHRTYWDNLTFLAQLGIAA